jgi:hypothetical protein
MRNVALMFVPAQFCEYAGPGEDQGEGFHTIKFVFVEETIGVVVVEKVEYHQSPAAFIGRIMAMLQECAIEEADSFATF